MVDPAPVHRETPLEQLTLREMTAEKRGYVNRETTVYV